MTLKLVCLINSFLTLISLSRSEIAGIHVGYYGYDSLINRLTSTFNINNQTLQFITRHTIIFKSIIRDCFQRFIYRLWAIITFNRQSYEEMFKYPFDVFKGALVFRITKYNIKNSVPLKTVYSNIGFRAKI